MAVGGTLWWWLVDGGGASFISFSRWNRVELSPGLPLTGTEHHVDDGPEDVQRRRRVEHVGPLVLGPLQLK